MYIPACCGGSDATLESCSRSIGAPVEDEGEWELGDGER